MNSFVNFDVRDGLEEDVGLNKAERRLEPVRVVVESFEPSELLSVQVVLPVEFVLLLDALSCQTHDFSVFFECPHKLLVVLNPELLIISRCALIKLHPLFSQFCLLPFFLFFQLTSLLLFVKNLAQVITIVRRDAMVL